MIVLEGWTGLRPHALVRERLRKQDDLIPALVAAGIALPCFSQELIRIQVPR
jgi:hypothetical protein